MHSVQIQLAVERDDGEVVLSVTVSLYDADDYNDATAEITSVFLGASPWNGSLTIAEQERALDRADIAARDMP